jgi:hypothetical protein
MISAVIILVLLRDLGSKNLESMKDRSGINRDYQPYS